MQNGFIRFEWQGSAQYAAVHSGIQMVQLVQMARLTTRTEIMPKIVSFAADVDPAVVASYRAFFGVDVTFDGGFYMAFPRPIWTANSHILTSQSGKQSKLTLIKDC